MLLSKSASCLPIQSNTASEAQLNSVIGMLRKTSFVSR